MANFTRNDFIDAMNSIKENIQSKGGTVAIAGSNPTPMELADGVNSLPNITVVNDFTTSPTGYVLKVAEMNGVTFTLTKGNEVIDTRTTPSPNGGVVTFNPSEGGEYTVTATANGETKWTNTIFLGDVGVYNCKSGLKMYEYAIADVLGVICKNHYAQYMFDYWDYIDVGSFVGSTADYARRAYFVSADTEVDTDGNLLGGTFVCFTPSTYRMNSQNCNYGGFPHSFARTQMLPNGSEVYVNVGTLSSSTSGTYYVKDWILDTWEEKTLPAEWTANTYYYQKQTLTADGAILAGFSADILPYVVASKQKYWRGWYKYGETSGEATEDNVTIEVADKLWIPTAMQMNGMPFNQWIGKYKTDIEGNVFAGCKDKDKNDWYYNVSSLVSRSQNTWYASPSVSYSGAFCAWYYSYGHVDYDYANYSYRLAVCFCV